MTAGLTLMKIVLILLAKSVLIPLGLLARMPVANVAIQKTIYGSGTISLIILNEEIEDIIKIVKLLEESRSLIKGISDNYKWSKRTKRRISFNVIRIISCYYIRKFINRKKSIKSSLRSNKSRSKNFNATSFFK